MATLTSTKIKNTYDALLKASDNDAIGSSAKQITDGLGNGTPLYISTTQIGIGVTPEATYDLHVYQNAKVGGNLTITGDLTVNGTTTTVDTDTLRVEDPLIEVARNNTSSDAVDIGIYGKYAPSGTTLYAGLFRDTGDDKFKLFKSLEEQPTTTVNTSGTGYAVATLVANFEGTLTGAIASTTTATTQSANDNSTKVATIAYVDTSAGNYLPLAGGTMSGNIAKGGNNISGGGTATFSSFVGDLTGNADTATALETARTIQVSGDVAGSASFDGTADINISTTIQANSVALGTDTTGNYVATISGTTNEIEVSGSGSETAAVTIGLLDDVTVTGELTVSGTGQSSFAGQVIAFATPSASTDAASKGYVDSQVGANNELSEVLANGNTTGGTDISVSSGDDITFADNSKSIYGAGSDLEIYHNGTNSVIDNNTNNLIITTASTTIITSDATDNELSFTHTNGNWFVKATTSNSLVLGSGSLVEDYVTIKGGGVVQLNDYGSGSNTGTATQRLGVDSSGNIIEISIGGGAVDGSGTANTVTMWSDTDTITDAPITINGNNATFAGNVIIGTSTTTPSVHYDNLVIEDVAGNNVGISLISGTGNNTALYFGDSADTDAGQLKYSHSTNDMFFVVNASTAMTINSSGNVGINYTAAPYKLSVNENGTATTNIGVYSLVNGAGTNNYAYADANSGTSTNFGVYSNSGKNAFLGDTGIGTDSPLGSSKLHVSSANGTAYTSSAQLRVSGGATNNNRATILFSDDALSDGKLSYYLCKWYKCIFFIICKGYRSRFHSKS